MTNRFRSFFAFFFDATSPDSTATTSFESTAKSGCRSLLDHLPLGVLSAQQQSKVVIGDRIENALLVDSRQQRTPHIIFRLDAPLSLFVAAEQQTPRSNPP